MHLLLNWGETANDLVIDPEYLSNMEHPRTSLASEAGCAFGYGTRHRQLVRGRLSDARPRRRHRRLHLVVRYSTSRDVGYVVLLNSTHSAEAMRRIAQLAVRYLKADVEPPPKPQADGRRGDRCATTRATTTTPTRATRRSRSSNGCCRRPDDCRQTAISFEATPVFGRPVPLDSGRRTRCSVSTPIPKPTRVFATDDAGTMVLTGGRRVRRAAAALARRERALAGARLGGARADAAADDDSVDRPRAAAREAEAGSGG